MESALPLLLAIPLAATARLGLRGYLALCALCLLSMQPVLVFAVAISVFMAPFWFMARLDA